MKQSRLEKFIESTMIITVIVVMVFGLWGSAFWKPEPIENAYRFTTINGSYLLELDLGYSLDSLEDLVGKDIVIRGNNPYSEDEILINMKEVITVKED